MKTIKFKVLMLMLILAISSSDLYSQTRIRFARGTTSATVSGRIIGGDERGYVLGARYGQYLTANVSSSSDCIVFGDGSTSIAYTTSNGNNYINLSNNCGRTVSFTLTVSIN